MLVRRSVVYEKEHINGMIDGAPSKLVALWYLRLFLSGLVVDKLSLDRKVASNIYLGARSVTVPRTSANSGDKNMKIWCFYY